MNINFEDIPKHTITDKSLLQLKQVMQQQDEYGIRKYGKELDPKDNYNWLMMFMEEMADGMKYIQCEMENKTDVIRILNGALQVLHAETKDTYIRFALEILTKTNTGK